MRGSPADDAEGITADRQAGHTVKEIAERYGWSMSAINRVIVEAGLKDRHTDYDPSPARMAQWCERHLTDLRREHGAKR